MTEAEGNQASTVHYFVDEAGDPVLFDRKGRSIVGSEGCSRCFILGKLDIDDPQGLGRELEALREELLADPYFRRVPSMRPEAKKTAVAFHAKDDLAEVRWQVFKLLARHQVRFYAVVRGKAELLTSVRQRNEQAAGYRYNENELYDGLVSELFRKLRRLPERMNICFAKRGTKDRTKALRAALEKAEQEFARDFGFKQNCEMNVTSGTPATHAGLQAVDYFMWALQRFYAKSEERYIELVWPQVGEIHDLDFIEQGRRGVYYRQGKPLCLEARQAQK